MGREAQCDCDWNGTPTRVKALLEPPDLILRGELRRRIPFAQIEQARADGKHFRFVFQGERVSLTLGSAMAVKWVEAVIKPAPSLAKKLGISSGTSVRIIGVIDDETLQEAINAAGSTSARAGDLILARVNTPAELERALASAAAQLARGTPIWFIYRKGRGHALTENDVRSTALATGIVDTKVAAVSQALTGLRFVKRRAG